MAHDNSRSRSALLAAGMLLVAVNLRAALASVGPLVAPVRTATGLSAAGFGLLTTLPLVAFGVVSVLAPAVTRRLGLGGALVAALTLITVGAAVRPLAGVALLFAGTAALGIGIALGNVLLPTLVKRDFAHRSGTMTSLYSSAMGVGATIAAGITVPLADTIGWRSALAVWALPAAVALTLWLPHVRQRKPGESTDSGLPVLRTLIGSPLAWQIALFMGFQSLTFYVMLAWLPDLLQARGIDAAGAGWLLAFSQATGIAGSATIPYLAGRRHDQRPVVAVLAAIEAVSLIGLLLPDASALTALWVGAIGFVMGGTFALALLFLVLRAPDPHTATGLSGMAQSIGYLIAAAGPAIFGFVHDATAGWTVPLLCLFGVLGVKVGAGLSAARDRVIALVPHSARARPNA